MMEKLDIITKENKTIDTRLFKVYFKLEIDNDGYPPVSEESIWAKEISGNLCEIDNIPFYAKGISYKDIICVERGENNNYYKSLYKSSGNSTIRIIFFNSKKIDCIINKLEKSGCTWEQGETKDFFSINIPIDIDEKPILEILKNGLLYNDLDYEESNISYNQEHN